jgi:hypothetical protein
MMKPQRKELSITLYRLLPILFMLAVSPESVKKLENLHSFVLATKESVVNIQNGLDNFHATMAPLMMTQAETKAGQDGR